MYEEFVESFQGDDRAGSGRDGGSGGVKAFVRGGVVAPGSRSTDATGGLGWCWVGGGCWIDVGQWLWLLCWQQ